MTYLPVIVCQHDLAKVVRHYTRSQLLWAQLDCVMQHHEPIINVCNGADGCELCQSEPCTGTDECPSACCYSAEPYT